MNNLETKRVPYPYLESNIAKCSAMQYEENYELLSAHMHIHVYTLTLIVPRVTALYSGLLTQSCKFSIRSCTGFGVSSSLVNPAHNTTE
jgi:hypothetical protein